MSSRICITGASGYLGRALCQNLDRSRLLALVRTGGAARLESGVASLELDVFDPDQLQRALAPGDTLVHLIGTPHPNPSKAAQFQRVDLGSVRDGARRLGMVTLQQMSRALMHAIETPPPPGTRRVLDVPGIRAA